MVHGEISGSVAIVGAGRVGATTAFALMNSGVASDIVLVDIDREKAEGEAMDLGHGATFVKPVTVRAGEYSDTWDADVVVITAGVSQEPGETRMELLERNTDVFRQIVPNVTEGLKDDATILVVTNPVDVLSYVTWRFSDLPANRVLGSGTVLDTARFRHVLSERCGVADQNVHAYVVGEHGDDEVPAWSATHIAGTDFDEFCERSLESDPREDRAAIDEQVRSAAYEIIDRKGATNYAIAQATVRIIEALLRDERSILTVSTLLDGQYGLEDVYLSMPAIVDRGGARQRIPLELSGSEREALVDSGENLKAEIETLDLP